MNSKRRQFLAGAAASTLGVSVATAATRTAARKTFLLVHGTWLGGWIWAQVADRLRGMGHRVFTPTLTGVGERHHLISPDIGLDTHITDLTQVIDFEELDQVILIGHSFSGMAATGAADRRRERIRHIAFFDAVIPQPGRMSAVEKNADGTLTDKFKERIPGFVDGYQMVFTRDYPLRMLIPDDQPALQASVARRLTNHPMKAWTDELELQHGGWSGLPRTAFRAARQAYAPSSEKMWGPATAPGWKLIDLPCTRMGMLTEPEIVAAAFARLG